MKLLGLAVNLSAGERGRDAVEEDREHGEN
jgi:hypothetical protein